MSSGVELVLAGGGGKGSNFIGVWKVFREYLYLYTYSNVCKDYLPNLRQIYKYQYLNGERYFGY